jgi:hypothetical protein
LTGIIREALGRAIPAVLVLAWYVILASVLGLAIVIGIPKLLTVFSNATAYELFGMFELTRVFDAMGLLAVIIIMAQGAMEAVRVFKTQGSENRRSPVRLHPAFLRSEADDSAGRC